MLFKLQVLSLTLSTDSAFTHYTPKFRSRNVFLDIWSQGQPKRRYFVGRYSKAKQKSFSSIVHFTSTPVILQLSYGVGDQTLLYNNLGRHTLFEFLSEPLSFQKKVLPFGRGGPLYKLEYSLAPVQVTYGFALNEVSCLGQVSSVLRKDPLYAEVELNASSHSILPGTTNRYHLGTFGSNDVATIHTSNNCTFSTLSNFVITFFINGWLSDHVLGSITVTPLDEHLQNKTAKLMALDLSDIDAASSLYYEDDDSKDEDNKQQQQQQQQSVENKETKTQQTKGKKKRKQKRRNNFMINEETLLKQQIEEEVNMLEKTRQQQNGVFLSVVVESPADEGAEPEEEELFMMDPAQTRQTKTLTLSSPEGGSYVIVFTLTKEYHVLIPTSSTSSSLPPSSVHTTTAMKQGTHVVPSAAWDYVNFRDNYIRQRELLKRSEQSVEDPPSSSSSSSPSSSSVIPAEPNSVRSSQFSQTTHGNSVDVLIDGVETFERIYECMMAAQHTISILAWEISLGFGLIRTHKSKIPLPSLTLPLSSKWVVLEDVLLSRALAGVVVRIIVWRHEILSRLNRFLYLGEVSIEREVAKMQKRCRKLNLICKVFDIMNMPDGNSEYSNPYDGADANVIVIIAGNPKGLYSCHHEKLVLIDAQCPEHAIAFTGGFDMARGRYDTPSHTPPRPFWEDFNPIASAHPHPHPSALPSAAVTELMGQPTEKELREREKQRGEQEERDSQEEQDEEERKKSFSSFSSSNQQTHHLFHRHHNACAEEDKEEVEVPFLNTRILWHDTHMMLSGPVVQRLQLHFAQRWRHAFTGDAALTRAQTHIIRASQTCQRHRRHQRLIKKMQFTNCNIRLTRVWNGVFEGHYLFDEYCKAIQGAKRSIYMEHQYPFQNFALTYYMCQALKHNPALQLIVVTPVKTDLPRGIVGEWFDWSQDQIIDHLHLIYRVAPKRVGIYGIVRQDDRTQKIKSIYVHSKIAIIDGEYLLSGSTNLDNMSLFYSSELLTSIHNADVATTTRTRLAREHLSAEFFRPSMEHDFGHLFAGFREVARQNRRYLRLCQRRRRRGGGKSGKREWNPRLALRHRIKNSITTKKEENQEKAESEEENEAEEEEEDEDEEEEGEGGEMNKLAGRPVSMAPEDYNLLLTSVHYPNKLNKMLIKAGIDTEDMWIKMRRRLMGTTPASYFFSSSSSSSSSSAKPKVKSNL